MARSLLHIGNHICLGSLPARSQELMYSKDMHQHANPTCIIHYSSDLTARTAPEKFFSSQEIEIKNVTPPKKPWDPSHGTRFLIQRLVILQGKRSAVLFHK
jgi:hypothetical protein